MKTTCRREILLNTADTTNCQCVDSPINVATAYTVKKRRDGGDMYIHVFSTLRAEIATTSCLYNHKVSITSDRKATVTLYTVYNNRLEWLESVNDVYASAVLTKDVSYTFILKFKVLVVTTSKRCQLQVCIDPLSQYTPPANYSTFYENGHTVVEPPVCTEREKYIMCKISKEYSIPRQLPRLPRHSLSPLPVNIEHIAYYLSLASMLTISNKVDIEYRYPPYSVKLIQSSNYQATLQYDIVLCPSAGQLAEITITAIESISASSYTLIKDKDGKELTHCKQGLRIQGTFLLPIGTPDVGLHIFTPYGFSADAGEDSDATLAQFKEFSINYVPKAV